MDIKEAKRIIELAKGNTKILVALFERGQVTSCIIEDKKRQFCQSCEADDELCNQYIEHLKERGYTATEIELDEIEPEESLPKFMESRLEILPTIDEFVGSDPNYTGYMTTKEYIRSIRGAEEELDLSEEGEED